MEKKPKNENEKYARIRKIDFETIAFDLYPRERKEILEPLFEKYRSPLSGDIDTDIMSSSQLEEFERSSKPYYQKLEKFIKEKPVEELYERAREVINYYIKEKGFLRAIQLSRLFLSEDEGDEVVRKYYENEKAELEKLRDEKVIFTKAQEILDNRDFIKSSEYKPPILKEKEIFDLLILLKSNPFTVYAIAKSLIETFGTLKKITPEIYAIIRQLARERLEKIIEKDGSERALEVANHYEKIGFLDIEKDSDLLDRLTSK